MLEALVGIVALLALLAFRVPVGFAIGIAGTLGLYLVGGWSSVLAIAETTPHTSASNYSLMAIPMFILMAQFVIISGVAAELFDTGKMWVGRVRGGLGIATTVAGGLFAALSGSSTASAATLAATAVPQMQRQGYDEKTSGALVAVVGTLAMMIPPSIALVLYGILAEQSVGQLLIAGIIPGILIIIALILTIWIIALLQPDRVPAGEKYSFAQKIKSLKTTWAIIVLFIMVSGSIYLGVATPTEASALGAFGAALITVINRRMSVPRLINAVKETALVTAMILTIVVGAHFFSYFLAYTGITRTLVDGASNSAMPAAVIMIIILLILLVMGSFMDQIAILGLAVPVVAPVAEELGFDMIWLGVMIVLVAEIGMITPPFGLNVFIVSQYTTVPVEKVFSGILPFFTALIIVVGILFAFPELVTWLPDQSQPTTVDRS